MTNPSHRSWWSCSDFEKPEGMRVASSGLRVPFGRAPMRVSSTLSQPGDDEFTAMMEALDGASVARSTEVPSCGAMPGQARTSIEEEAASHGAMPGQARAPIEKGVASRGAMPEKAHRERSRVVQRNPGERSEARRWLLLLVLPFLLRALLSRGAPDGSAALVPNAVGRLPLPGRPRGPVVVPQPVLWRASTLEAGAKGPNDWSSAVGEATLGKASWAQHKKYKYN